MGAIAPRTVHLEVAADVVEVDESGQCPLLCRLYLPPILAQLRWHPLHANGAEDFLLRLTADPFAFFRVQVSALGATASTQGVFALPGGYAEDTVLVDAQATLDPELAHSHVVGLRTREVVQCRPVRAAWDDTQIHLQPRPQHHGAACRAGPLHVLDVWVCQEVLHEWWGMCTHGEEVDIAHRLLVAPVAPRYVQGLDTRPGMEVLEEGLDELVSLDEQKAPRVLGQLGDSSAQVGGSLGAKAGQRFHLPGIDGRRQLRH